MADFWIGCLSSFGGSMAIILILFVSAKPKFKISKEICYLHTNEFGTDVKGSYLIKVTNRSFFVSYDLRANLEKLVPYHVDGGTNDRAFDLKLVDHTTKYLAGMHAYNNTGRSAFLFRTKEDLKGIISDSNSKLRFTLIARNGFSGLTKIFIQEFNTSGAIKDGHFGFGKDFEIRK